MEDKFYPREQFEQDLESVKRMDIPDDLKLEKGTALAYLYGNQEKNWVFNEAHIAEYRENILGKAL